MRRASTVLLALALAACSVEIEGAACDADANCPSGQACGLDRRCSVRAASAECARCERDAVRCDGAAIATCSHAADAVCGAWIPAPCEAGLVCADAPAVACVCPANTTPEFFVDASGGSDAHAAPAPTGVAAPARCRFRTLARGLEAAEAHGAPAAVIAGGPAAVFSTAGEGPVVVPPGVTLRREDLSAGAPPHVIALDSPVTAGVTLSEGSGLRGFTIRNVSAPDDARGVLVSCASQGTVTVEDVDVEAARTDPDGRLVEGVHVEGLCAALLDAVTVRGAGRGLHLAEHDAAEPVVEVSNATITGCGDGVRLDVGSLRMSHSAVTSNTASGIVAGDGDGDTELTLSDVLVSANGDTGVRLNLNRRVELRGTRICANEAASVRETPFASRRVGGLYIVDLPPATIEALVFTGNSIFENAGDQVLVVGSEEPWRLDGASSIPACVTEANLFTGYDDDLPLARGIFAAFADVSARFNAWSGLTPRSASAGGRDFEEGPSANIDAGTTDGAGQFCLPVPPPACE